TMHLWRGAYQIHHVEVVKTTGHVPVPLFSAPLIDLSVQWRALFDGAFVGNIDFFDPKMNFVNAPSKEKQWQQHDWRIPRHHWGNDKPLLHLFGLECAGWHLYQFAVVRPGCVPDVTLAAARPRSHLWLESAATQTL